MNTNRNDEHGRIYRVVWADAEPSDTASLAGASTQKLVEPLRSDNEFWRMTAQRILVQERHDEQSKMVAEPSKLVEEGTSGGIYALWTLKTKKANKSDTWRKRSLNLAASINGVQKQKTNVIKSEEHYTFGNNLLPNPSFENNSNSSPAGWTPRTYQNMKTEDLKATTHEVDKTVAHSGSNSLKISSKNGADTSFQTDVSVELNTVYRLSGWIRSRNVSGAFGALSQPEWKRGKGRTGTGWHRHP